MKKWLSAAILAALLLSGCRPSSDVQIGSRVVTEIVATCEEGDHFVRRYYNTSEKMSKILMCIRSLGPKFSPEADPEGIGGSVICLTMTCSDGSVKLHRLIGDRYYQEGTGDWKRVNREKAAALWQAVWDTPSDPEQKLTFHSPPPRLTGGWIYSPGQRRIRAQFG